MNQNHSPPGKSAAEPLGLARWSVAASEDPLSLHKYLYVEDNPVNKIDPNGRDPDLDMDLPSPTDVNFVVNAGAEYIALDLFYIKGPVGRKLVCHWLGCKGTTLKLSIGDMVELGARSMYTWGYPSLTDETEFSQYVGKLSGGAIQIHDLKLYLGANERATLGRFWGHVNGTLSGSPDNWKFVGTMDFTDTEKFDQSETGTRWRNAVCWCMAHGAKGADYDVTSEEAPISQSSSDGQIIWAGTGKGFQSSGNPENDNPTGYGY